MSKRDAYVAALRWRADLMAAGASDDDLETTAESLQDAYTRTEDGPEGVPPVDKAAINLLRLGPDRYKAPPPTLGDARQLYLKEHLGSDNPQTDGRVIGLANRVIDAAIAAMGRDPALSAITGEDARAVRDHIA